MIESDNVTDNLVFASEPPNNTLSNPPFLLASKMAAKMREATCAAPLTSKVPTEVGLLL